MRLAVQELPHVSWATACFVAAGVNAVDEGVGWKLGGFEASQAKKMRGFQLNEQKAIAPAGETKLRCHKRQPTATSCPCPCPCPCSCPCPCTSKSICVHKRRVGDDETVAAAVGVGLECRIRTTSRLVLARIKGCRPFRCPRASNGVGRDLRDGHSAPGEAMESRFLQRNRVMGVLERKGMECCRGTYASVDVCRCRCGGRSWIP